MPLKFTRHPNVADFLCATESMLRGREAENSLLLGIPSMLRDSPELATIYTEPPRFFSVSDGPKVRVAAFQTPPYKMVMPRATSDEIECMVEGIYSEHLDLVGVQAESEVAAQFVDAWCRATGASVRRGMSMRIHQLDRVNDVPTPPGAMRIASPADIKLIAEWMVAFAEDAGTEPNPDPRGWTERAIAAGESYLWDHDGPTSLTTWGRATANGASIRGVYTPPEHRRKGYATALVAGVSRELLDGGKKFCCLFTDLDNPTSNHIYAEIGYYPVCDVDDYWFEARA